MSSIRVQTGSIEPIIIKAVDAAGDPLTGLADLFVRIRRESDGLTFDTAGAPANTFRTVGASTTPDQLLTEISAADFPGMYELVGGFDMSSITNLTPDEIYQVIPLQDPGTTAQLPPPGELREGSYVDDIAPDADSQKCRLSATYLAGGVIRMDAWLKNGPMTDPSPTSCQVAWYQRGIVAPLFTTALNSTPDARGHFDFSQSQALDPGEVYHAEITIISGADTVVTDEPTPLAGS